jgi:uncharacterized protein YlxP (DUF503 family)
MAIGLLTLHILLPVCKSLKEKRSQIKPLLARLHKEFNISVAEVDRQDMWREAVIACVLVSNESRFAQKALNQVLDYTQNNWPEIEIVQHRIEII